MESLYATYFAQNANVALITIAGVHVYTVSACSMCTRRAGTVVNICTHLLRYCSQ